MKRYPVYVLTLMAALVLSGCAHKKTQEEVSQIARRVGHLENEVVDVRTDMTMVKEDIHDQDLRLQFLEYEAVQRGDPIAPRRSMSTPDPYLTANGGRVVLPEPLTPTVSSTLTSPGPWDDQTAALAQTPVRTSQPAPVTQTPAANLPESPSSTASPEASVVLTPPVVTTEPVVATTPSSPGTLPAPVQSDVEPVVIPDPFINSEPQLVASLPPGNPARPKCRGADLGSQNHGGTGTESLRRGPAALPHRPF